MTDSTIFFGGDLTFIALIPVFAACSIVLYIFLRYVIFPEEKK